MRSQIVAYMALSLYFLALLAVTYIALLRDPTSSLLLLLLALRAFAVYALFRFIQGLLLCIRQ